MNSEYFFTPSAPEAIEIFSDIIAEEILNNMNIMTALNVHGDEIEENNNDPKKSAFQTICDFFLDCIICCLHISN